MEKKITRGIDTNTEIMHRVRGGLAYAWHIALVRKTPLAAAAPASHLRPREPSQVVPVHGPLPTEEASSCQLACLELNKHYFLPKFTPKILWVMVRCSVWLQIRVWVRKTFPSKTSITVVMIKGHTCTPPWISTEIRGLMVFICCKSFLDFCFHIKMPLGFPPSRC